MGRIERVWEIAREAFLGIVGLAVCFAPVFTALWLPCMVATVAVLATGLARRNDYALSGVLGVGWLLGGGWFVNYEPVSAMSSGDGFAGLVAVMVVWLAPVAAVTYATFRAFDAVAERNGRTPD